MLKNKLGVVLQICTDDNIGIVRDHKTKDEFIFFLDELTKSESRSVKVGSEVSFFEDDLFDYSIAKKIVTIYPKNKAA